MGSRYAKAGARVKQRQIGAIEVGRPARIECIEVATTEISNNILFGRNWREQRLLGAASGLIHTGPVVIGKRPSRSRGGQGRLGHSIGTHTVLRSELHAFRVVEVAVSVLRSRAVVTRR